MTDGFLGFALVAAESDKADPFAAADLAAAADVSLIDALQGGTASVNDDFIDFTQSIEPSGDDEFADFWCFHQSFINKKDNFTDLKQSCAELFGEKRIVGLVTLP
ncbi:unnamed protein product [Peronospora belbahrii]|uniref:Uncharacterized protein n=1 Tax=Peronospora belbahrii TaxID=622444 RepID=A0AAU9LAY8_9STRA|nr:unnamed protein product [Peronospora belbahrii]